MRTMFVVVMLTLVGGVAAQEASPMNDVLEAEGLLLEPPGQVQRSEVQADSPRERGLSLATAREAALADEGLAQAADADLVYDRPAVDGRLLRAAEPAEVRPVEAAPEGALRPEQARMRGDEPREAGPGAVPERASHAEEPLRGDLPQAVGPEAQVVVDPLCAFDGSGCMEPIVVVD